MTVCVSLGISERGSGQRLALNTHRNTDWVSLLEAASPNVTKEQTSD